MVSGAAAFTALFVRRPVLALVVNALVVVAGLAAFRGIEIRELPDIDRPVVTVTVTYTGASPETVDAEITSTVEGAASRVAGVENISGQSQFGRSRVTVEFSDDVDLNVAANDLRDAVSRVRNTLPDDADEPQIVKADADSDPIMRVAVTSDTLSIEALTTLVEERVLDRLAAVDGVADVQEFGDQEAVFRVDINQAALAARGLTVADLSAALDSVDFDAPAGSLQNADQSLVVRADARLVDAAAIGNLLIDPNTRLADVAAVTLGPDLETSQLRVNGHTGIGLGIVRAAKSNTIEISAGVRKAVAELAATMPPGVELFVTSDDAQFIRGALHEVEIALGLGVVIVVAVIFLFLGDLKATLIPAVTIPVSLIGTLAAMWLVGFSVNILTLLALVLATGLVVDDAIVVLENIVRRRAMGARARAAAVVGTREVFFAVLATTATLAAVFVPISFLPGVAGGLFREFGFVLAISVLISSVTALTFAPMLAATILGDAGRARRRSILGRIVGGAGNLLAALYARLLRAALAAPLVVIVASSAFAFAAWIAFLQLPQELTPKEDRGSVALSVTAPQGVSIDYMGRQMDRINAVLKPYLDSGEGAAVFTIAGRNGANSGFAILTLAPWEERARSQTDIAAEIGRKVAGVPGVRAFTLSSNSLGIRGGGQGLRIALLGPDYASLATEGDKLVAALEATPELANVRLDFQATQPQLSVVIDRDRAQDLGVSITGLGEALQAVLDGREVATVNVADQSIPVKLVSTGNPIDDPGDLAGVFVRTRDGRMVPMSSIATIREEATAPSLSRESQQRAVPITADLDNSTALRAGLDAARTVAAATLPPGFRIVPLGEAATLEETSGGFATTFGFALVVILLVLAAQFESFVAALIIIATVPFGLAAAVFAIALTGGTLNLYSQIGLVMLVGIMAKNGILIVEFANHLRDEGRGVRAAILEASLTRLRPVSMTMIATVVGAVPLVLAFGAGAEARVALGWVLVGGLGFATVFTLFLTPVAYLLLAGFSKPRAEGEARLARELEEAEEARLAGDDEPTAPTEPIPEPSSVAPAPPAPSPAE
ncbi:efflux RND transporter permease subunit [Oharaeibacter diazotrophicus]|uniref:HAE1 family hydrophobic/amphiphilic exporter-1 n=1 Tax=Oharaeibacter diazotrophicus TaxID=1920512 RepID=A0A4R6RG72_9HYPH|nr:efflux RND transporter permease subunit [Oharaeibacter diazotrophicus]TDP85333.1 HAE1 family hydrophobic/amphiphilic exporter-1 [Oharaeibacter diazotrophicus]BBE74303.1 multidrug resistance protein MdtC [Pleomorphomonas sp. SM30]GLS76006.1 multidrug transporter AcrB [Oharaeibacter diazotrophicus]